MNLLKKLSIQSKLTLVLLAVSISSILVIAFIGYRSGKQALSNSIHNQLASLRFTTSQSIENYFQEVNRQVLSFAENPTTVTALTRFNQSYAALKERSPNSTYATAISQYYQGQFIPKLKPNVQGEPIAKTYEPLTSTQQYLQYHYTIQSNDFDEKAKIVDPGDGSLYSQVHRTFHPFLRNFNDEFEHEDLFLIDPEGNVLYTVYKGVDFATNLKSGPLENSVLAQAFNAALQERTPGYIAVADYQPYRPSFNEPAAIIATPIFFEGTFIGVLAIQISSAPINQVMTYRQQWNNAGLGKTGETYLVGPDSLMRSDSRFFLESADQYFQSLQAIGTPPSQIDKIKRLNTTILQQQVNTDSASLALAGKQGTQIIRDYRNVSVLSSFSPLDLPGLNWGVIAEINEDEVFAPIRQFQKQVFISTAIIVLAITILALMLSHLIVRPIKTLQEGFKKLEKGQLDTQIHLETQDEFKDLATAFNEMVGHLRQKTQLLNQKSQENETLLLSILPSPIAKRLKQGEVQIADHHPNVTVLFADLVGFAHLCDCRSAEDSVAMLNQLVTTFDEAIDRYGIEKVKTIGSGYMAVGGLSIPRIDHMKRVLDFGLDMIRVVQVFNRTHQTQLEIQIGVHSGAVVAGIVGKSKFIYDLWGDTVNIAFKMRELGSKNSIHLTDTIYQQLKDFYPFIPHHPMEVEADHVISSWLLQAEN
ncbi:adenylate/guanylate cyclase domain-containing protein [Lyngbya confervoides]|uniref:HAMP domain-containing protein n=1 Tax=Lyngbya confervoides BDU141951 TaxID=1574623 RepID=A0ABD4T2H3_9CYAN|nr:adenylate/guanylate cyclase domain-containing protein [Lyngbya confervoides]MCM1982799.1 HAMP domain-containing protein [Lyngbya confervoides BDU141951]